MRTQLVALVIALTYPFAAIAATPEGGAGTGPDVKKESSPAGASGAPSAYGSPSGGITAPETKAAGSAKDKAKSEAKKGEAKDPSEMGARGEGSAAPK